MTTYNDTANFSMLVNGSVVDGSVIPGMWNFSDDDTGTGIDDFEIINSGAATAIDVTQNPGDLTIDTNGVSKWRNGFFSVPGLRIASALSGDFEIQASIINFPGDLNYESQMVGAYNDLNHGAWVGRSYNSGKRFQCVTIAGVDTAKVASVDTIDTAFIRLNRSTNSVEGYYRENVGDAWTIIDSAAVKDINETLDLVVAAENYSGTAFTGILFDYVKIVAGGSFVAEALIHNAGLMCLDAGAGNGFDFSTASFSSTGSPTVKFQYAKYSADQGWITKDQVDAGAAWNGIWLTLEEFQAVENTGEQYLYVKVQVTGNASQSFDEMAIDTYVLDVTPPGVPTSTKFSAFESDNYAMIWDEPVDADFDHCEIKRVIDGTTTYLVDDGAGLPVWATSGTAYTFASGNSASDCTIAGYIDKDVSGTDITYYVRSVDLAGNASAWTAFTAGLEYDVVHWQINDTGGLSPRNEPLPLNYPAEADTRNGTVYGYEDQYTGELIGGGAEVPGKAAISSVVAGDEQLTVTVIPATGSEDVPIYLRYRTTGDWSDESDMLKRTGEGDVTITGLTNNITHTIEAYHKDGIITGDWSAFAWGIPTNGANLPTGPINKVIEVLRDMFSASSAWQLWTSSIDATTARTKTFNGGIDIPDSEVDHDIYLRSIRPTAVMWVEGEFSQERIAVDSSDNFVSSGTIYVGIDANLPDGYAEGDTIQAADIWFNRVLGETITEVLEQSGTAGCLTLSAVNVESGPELTSRGQLEDVDEFIQVVLAFSFGGTA